MVWILRLAIRLAKFAQGHVRLALWPLRRGREILRTAYARAWRREWIREIGEVRARELLGSGDWFEPDFEAVFGRKG